MYKAFKPVHPIHDISGTALLSRLKYCSTVLVFSCAGLDQNRTLQKFIILYNYSVAPLIHIKGYEGCLLFYMGKW